MEPPDLASPPGSPLEVQARWSCGKRGPARKPGPRVRMDAALSQAPAQHLEAWSTRVAGSPSPMPCRGWPQRCALRRPLQAGSLRPEAGSEVKSERPNHTMGRRCASLRAAVLLGMIARASGFLGAAPVTRHQATTAYRSSTYLAPRLREIRFGRQGGATGAVCAAAGTAGEKVTAPEGAPHILLLPGFGNAQQDYVNPFSGPVCPAPRGRGSAPARH